MVVPASVRTLRVHAAVALLILTFGCGGSGGSRSTPTQPSPSTPTPTPSPTPSAGLMTGLVVDLTTGSPVAGATLVVNSGTATLTTNASGGWEYTQSASAPQPIPMEVSAPGYVTRRVHVRWQLAARTDIRIDLIRDAAPFSIDYYRQIVRNMFSVPEGPPEQLRRWSTNPNFYINVSNPRAGGEIPQIERDRLTTLIRDAVPAMTGGRLQAGTIEFGVGERPLVAGVISLTFTYEPESEFCGTAQVGANPGRIWINYGADNICGSRCGNFAWSVVVHEIGHAMGFWHVREGFIMNVDWFDRDCDKVALSPAEQFHMNIAYARPRGNLDPDIDPANATLLQTEGPAITLRCR